MADLKISQLTASTTPLAGTEVLPIVQSSTTKKVSVANLTTGRAVTVKSLNAATGLSGATQATDITISRTSSTGAVLTGPNIYLDDGTANNTIAIQNGAGYLQVYGYNGSFVELLAMNNTGNLSLKTGNLVISTSGKGIDFSATSGTGTSELLADYEEGTWTPVFNPGSGSITTQTCSGTYTKVGRVVVAQFSIVINNVGTGVGVSSVSGLPFTSANTTDTGSGSVREYNLTGFEWNFTVNPNATTMYPARYDNVNAIATNVAWRGAVTYTV